MTAWLRGEQGDELSPEDAVAVLQRVYADLWARTSEQSAHRCKHGVNLERAGCWPCIEASEKYAAAFVVALDVVSQTEDEAKGTALAARFEREQ